MIAPASSALFFSLLPILQPKKTPASDKENVIEAMPMAAGIIFPSISTKVSPAAKASMLVAMERKISLFNVSLP